MMGKTTGNHLMKSFFLEKPQSPVAAFCCTLNRVNDVVFVITDRGSLIFIRGSFSCRQLRVPEDFIEKFKDLSNKLEKCAEEAKEEEENAPEVIKKNTFQ